MTPVYVQAIVSSSGVIDREFGLGKEVLVAPSPHASRIVGKALPGATISTVLVDTTVFVFAPSADVSLSPLPMLGTIGAMPITGLGLSGPGLFMAARMSSFEGFGTINDVVVMALSFLSAREFSLDRAPSWIEVLAAIHPLGQAVDLLRGLIACMWHYNAALDPGVIVAFALLTLNAATVAPTRQR